MSIPLFALVPLTAFLLSALQPAAPPAPAATETPASQQLRAWLLAFNTADPAVLRPFLEAHYPTQLERLDPEVDFSRRIGGFQVRKLEAATPTTATLLVQEGRSDQFARLTIEVDAAPPHRIKDVARQPVPRPAEFALTRLTDAALADAVRGKADAEAKADRFSGAVLVTRRGKTLVSGAYGLADREKKTANTLDTKFRIGSMNKMITAVATLQLAQAGKIKLTEPLGTYLPDYPNKEVASKVTIHQLLTHTGGTGNIFGPEFDRHRLELRTLTDYVTLYGARAPAYEPGARWAYSNYGFLLLGVVVERVSGRSYYDYVRERIYVPAGMTGTASQPEDEAVPARSAGYMLRENAWRNNAETLPYRGTSAGGGYSTVGDLAKFADALLGHTLLNASHTTLALAGKVETGGPDNKYAYGFMDVTENSVRTVGHGGGAPGQNGELTIFPDSGVVIVVLANLDPPAASRVAQFIKNRVTVK